MRFLCFFLLSLTAFAASDRIRTPIDGARTVPLPRRVHPMATAEADRGQLDPDFALDEITMLFKPGPGLDELLTAQQIPGSPDYRRWLTPEQFGDRFGL